jgi:spore coat protein JB
MDKSQLCRQLTAEQFAAFDVRLYLDTHPHDADALSRFCKYHSEYADTKEKYELMYGPISPDSAAMSDTYTWPDDPWPWESEAN